MSRINARFALCLALICWTAAAVVPASAQHFQQIPGSLVNVSAGANEVWGYMCTKVFCLESDVYTFDSSTKKFIKAPKPPVGLGGIAVGGGTLMQPDEVWALDVQNNVYQYNHSKKKFNQVQVPSGGLFQIAVGPGYEDNCHPYEVWGIWGPNVENPGTFRYNYCTLQFDSISNPSGVSFSQIATGGGDVWAVSSTSVGGLNVWNYLPSYGGWFPGGFALSGFTGNFSQVTVGVNDVWGIFSLNGSDCIIPWAATGGPGVEFCFSVTEVAAGGDGMWILSNNTALRYDFQQSGFVPSLATVVQIAVGSGAGVWAVDSSNNVYAFVRP
jgi:hypothetical protein